MMTSPRSIALAVVMFATATPGARAEEPTPPSPGPPSRDAEAPRVLTGDEIREVMTDADLYGCYVDGRPSWGERTGENGVFYDLLDETQRRLGIWAVINDSICYRYDGGGTFCYSVEESRQGWSFYSTFDGALVAQTFCDDDAAV